MSLEVGIVGLPNSGKTTLFNALTRAGAEITAYASVARSRTSGWRRSQTSGSSRVAELVGCAEGDAGRDQGRRRARDGPAAARQPPAGRRAPRSPRRLLRRTPTPGRDLETPGSSCSSPIASTSSDGSSGCGRRRSPAISRSGRKPSCSSGPRPPRRGPAAVRVAGRAAARARAADDEAAPRDRERSRRYRLQARDRACGALRVGGGRSFATGRLRSTRSSGVCRTRSA